MHLFLSKSIVTWHFTFISDNERTLEHYIILLYNFSLSHLFSSDGINHDQW